MKLLKYAIYLFVIFFSFQYLNKLIELPSFAIPEEFSSIIFKKIPSVSSIPESLKKNTSVIIKKIQNNELQDIQGIWKELGVKSGLFKNGSPFLAESFTIPLNSEGNQLHIFKITNNETNDWQYLCFNIKNRSWNFFGHIDLPNQDQSEPLSRTVSIEERIWLVITSKTDSPDLPGMYQDRWYDLNAPKLREVLQYHVYQDQSIPGFIKRYSSTVAETGITAGSYFVDINSKITYLNNQTSKPDLETAFSLSRKVRYLWDTANQSFKNHQRNNLYTYGADEILTHNYLPIEDLALNGDSSQRNLVRSFLNLCSNSSEKSRILKILR